MVVIALLGGTGRVGGWVLEEALEKGFTVRVLARAPSKLATHVEQYPDTLIVVEGSSTVDADVEELVDGTDVVISTLGSPSPKTLIMKTSAETLTAVLRGKDTLPRVLWMTTIGVNEATEQGHEYGISNSCCPSCTLCCGYGLCGCLIFKCVIPCIIGQDFWDDMGESEDVFRLQENVEILKHTVIVRPTNMTPVSEHAAFTDEWRAEGGDNTAYETRKADEPPPNMSITRRAISAFLLDHVENTEFDGQAISLFQGKP